MMEGKKQSICIVGMNKCCSCGACIEVCPKKAIRMEMDSLGSFYPKIDDRCIHCGLCLNVCPVLNDVTRSTPKQGCAAVSKLEHDQSASGGVFYTLASKFLKEPDSVVYGATMTSNMDVVITRATEEGELCSMQGSKYVKSSMGNAFYLVKSDLEAGKKVLFSAAPCQIAALKSYLKIDYENLYMVDIVCHGMPGAGLFHKYIMWLENRDPKVKNGNASKTKKAVTSYRFRNKTPLDRDGFVAKVGFSDGTEKKIVGKYDPYYGSFLDSEIFTKACYSCKYASAYRVSDITIGDWNTRGKSRFHDWRPVSIALVNTERGQKLWDTVSSLFETADISLEAEMIGNKQLSQPSSIEKYKPSLCAEMMNGEFDAIWRRRIDAVPAKKRIEEKLMMRVPFRTRKKIIHFIKDVLHIE